jgi:hypothetical protein
LGRPMMAIVNDMKEPCAEGRAHIKLTGNSD